MSRRRYLVTYDIADDRRRTRVFDTCHAWGDHTQYSVFVCDLDARELVAMQAEMDTLIHHVEDQILYADLGPAERATGAVIAALGKPYSPPTRALVV